MWTQEKIDKYLSDHPDADPAKNQLMREVVNGDDYYDRGMWGPLGGKGGTPSQPSMDEIDRLEAGGPSELSLMTIVTPQGEVMTLAQHQQRREQEAEADRLAMEGMMRDMAADEAAYAEAGTGDLRTWPPVGSDPWLAQHGALTEGLIFSPSRLAQQREKAEPATRPWTEPATRPWTDAEMAAHSADVTPDEIGGQVGPIAWSDGWWML